MKLLRSFFFSGLVLLKLYLYDMYLGQISSEQLLEYGLQIERNKLSRFDVTDRLNHD